jgi:hypothetical protein
MASTPSSAKLALERIRASPSASTAHTGCSRRAAPGRDGSLQLVPPCPCRAKGAGCFGSAPRAQSAQIPRCSRRRMRAADRANRWPRPLAACEHLVRHAGGRRRHRPQSHRATRSFVGVATANAAADAGSAPTLYVALAFGDGLHVHSHSLHNGRSCTQKCSSSLGSRCESQAAASGSETRRQSRASHIGLD